MTPKRIGLQPATIDAEFALPDHESDGTRLFVPVPLTRSREEQFTALQEEASKLDDGDDGPEKTHAAVDLMSQMVDVVLASKGDAEGPSAGDMLREGYEHDRMTIGQISQWFASVVNAAQDPTSVPA